MRRKSDFFKPVSDYRWADSHGRSGEFDSAFGN